MQSSGVGMYYTADNRKETIDGFATMTQGIMVKEELVAVFTIYTGSSESEIISQALTMLTEVKHIKEEQQ